MDGAHVTRPTIALGLASTIRPHATPDLFREAGFMENALVEFIQRTRGRHRQVKRKSGAFAFFACGFNATPVMMHDEETSHQMNTVFRRRVGAHHEWIKETLQFF